jgi:hypothetical protein
VEIVRCEQRYTILMCRVLTECVGLVSLAPSVIQEQNASPAKNTTSGPDEPVGLTVEEEKELAELMGDEDGI